MSAVFSKSAQKRSRTSSNETKTSFVENVTSRVSSLLPSKIVKWFSRPNSSSTNGSAATAEAEDSSTEDEGPESPIVIPAKRMRFNTPTNFNNNYGPSDTNCSTSNIEITEVTTPFTGTQYTASRNNVTLTPIKVNETTNDITKEKSEAEPPLFRNSQHTVSNIGQSIATKRKSIFDKTPDVNLMKKKLSQKEEKKPYFKPHLIGSTFYPGRTMYGGAASSHMSQANIQQHTVAQVNEAKGNEDSAMSTSTRRIMDLLESYSSPLMEARRIPQYIKPKNQNSTSSTPESANKSMSYKTQELYVPRQASLLRLKQKSRLMDSTITARQIIASQSSTSNDTLYYSPKNATDNTAKASPSNHPRQTLKMEKSYKITNSPKSWLPNRHTEHNMELATPVKLPSVVLKIDQNKLPKFTLDTQAVNKLPATSTPKVALSTPKQHEVKMNTQTSKSKPETVSNCSVFTFSNPVKISCDTPDADITPPLFTFDSPERRIEKNDSQSHVSSVVGVEEDNNNQPKISSETEVKDWQCPDCWVNNKAGILACVCCGFKKQKASKCTVCKIADSQVKKDKCVICEKMSSPPSDKSSKWKCGSCWIMNDASANKCVCCGFTNLSDASKTAKTKDLTNIPKTTLASYVWGSDNMTNTTSNSNGSTNDTKPVTTSSFGFFGSSNNGDGTLTSIAKTQKSNRWECPCCLVMNESNNSMCVCCGGENKANNKLPEVKFNFGSVSNTTFKFGIDPKVQEATIAKKPDVISTKDVKEKSEANNNLTAETPTYTFTLPAKKEEAKVDITKPKPGDVNKSKFSFGIPKLPEATDKKSELCKPTVEEQKKVQVVPQIKNDVPVQETPKLLGDSKANQLIKQTDNSVVSISAPIPFTSPPVDVNKDILSKPKLEEKPISINKPEPQSILSPVPSSSKPTSSLFGIPSTMTSSSASLTQSPQNVVSTISSATPALPITSLPITSLPKSEITTSMAPSVAKPVVAASLFSFGEKTVNNVTSTPSTTLSAVATTDKPSFQFTFGGNNIKTDTPPSLLPSTQSLFSSPFASREETPKAANNFGFNGGNTLGTSNAISTLGGPNGLPGSNGLSNNDRPTNSTLGANNLTLNTLGSTLSTNNLSGNMLTGNTLNANTFGTNTLTAGNNAASATTIGGINGLPGNSLAPGNGLQQASTLNNNSLTNSSTNIFGSGVQKENNTMWNSSNASPSTNLFVANSATNNPQKPPAFSFGTSNPFKSNNSGPTFGSNSQPVQNIFGVPAQNNNNQSTLFTSPIQSQVQAPMFGSPQPSSNPTPQMGLFGTPAIGTTPGFGAPNPSISTFDAPSMPSTAAPAFNFGSPVQSTGVFGFGQQQQQQQQPQPQQAGVYSFGGASQAAPQVQFAMGTAPNSAGRRPLRKAARRITTPR